MRAYIIPVLLVMLLAGAGITISADEFSEYVPEYFTNPSLAPVVQKNMENYAGTVTYSLYSAYAEYWEQDAAGKYEWVYGWRIKADNYCGVLSGVSHYPAFRFTTRYEGMVEIVNNALTDQGSTLYGVPGTTLFSLYHVGDTDELLAYLELTALATPSSPGLPSSYKVDYKLVFVHRKLNMSTGNYTDTILYHVVENGVNVPGTPRYIIVDMVVVPLFYDWYDPDAGEHYLTFGFRGWFNIHTPEAIISNNKFQFAWHTYNIGPRENSTLEDVARFVEQTRGWYVWIGAGLRYYKPYGSEMEIYPENTYRYYTFKYSTNTSEDAVLNDVSVTGTLKIAISSVAVYNYIVDIQKLYALFRYGGLENYRGAYIKPGNVTVIAGNYEETVNLVKPLLPLVIPLVILFPFLRDEKISRTVVVTAYMVMAVALGVGMGIFGVPELVSIILVFVSVHVIKSRSPSPDDAGG